MAEAGVSEDHSELICPLCLSLLRNPVTTPCGHSFCKVCIKGYWDQDEPRRVYRCPECLKVFMPRPVVHRNDMLFDAVKKLKMKEAEAASPAAGPEDVECALCLGKKVKAVKSCLTCLTSFCETHVKLHYQLPGLKTHKLVEASKKQQEKICSQHDKPLEIYCRTDQIHICSLCEMEEHNGHDTVSAAAEKTRKQLEINPPLDEDVLSGAHGLLETLQQQIADMKRRNAELDQLGVTDDPNKFKSPVSTVSSGSEVSPSITVHQPPSFDGINKSLSELKEQLAQLFKFSDIPPLGTEPGSLGTSPDPEVFIPEMSEKPFKNNNSYRFLYYHTGQFQCKVTNLVFEMEGKGEVLYRIESWDTPLLDGLGQMKPAGPLYNIECFEGSVSHLHLPHCEILSGEHQAELAVAHFTGDNLEIIQPLRVTNTHVIISIQGFSLFGLLKKIIFYASPVNAQVLLFYKDISGKQIKKKLHIHLLPQCVPTEEVKNRYTDFRNINTSSRCQLIPGRKYRPSCDPYVSQPKVEQFECDYGPNYHPTFEVFLESEAEDVKLALLDEDDQEIWEPRLILLTDDDATTTPYKMDPTDAEFFVDKNWPSLIQKVPSVMEIADCLKSKLMMTDEMYSNIYAVKTSQDQMRLLYRALNSGGTAVKTEFFEILKKKQPYLVNELNQTSMMRP